MKVYTYDTADGRFMSNFLPTDAANVIVYDKSNLLDRSSIFSNAIEDNWVAKMVIWFWDNPQRMDVVNIDY
jgi:hypothetical protein